MIKTAFNPESCSQNIKIGGSAGRSAQTVLEQPRSLNVCSISQFIQSGAPCFSYQVSLRTRINVDTPFYIRWKFHLRVELPTSSDAFLRPRSCSIDTCPFVILPRVFI